MNNTENNTKTERLIYCSFCGRHQFQAQMICETAGAAICNICVDQCHALYLAKVEKDSLVGIAMENLT